MSGRTAAVILVLGLGAGVAAAAATGAEADDCFLALQKAFQKAANTAAPYVVHIEVKRTMDVGGGASSGRSGGSRLRLPPEVLERFQENRRYFVRPEGGTSGVILSSDGYIITTYYNIVGAVRSVKVTLADGRSFPAEILGKHPDMDVALLKIGATGLPVPKIDPGLDRRPGQFCIAVGRGINPKFHTLTTGIISAHSRERKGNAFQISARVNYENAGGAVVDLRGRLLGIVSRVAHMTSWGGYIWNRAGLNTGVGLATPMGRILDVLPRLKSGEEIPRWRGPFLGIRFDQVHRGEGTKIEYVYKGLPSEKAGLRPGDIIISFNNIQIETRNDLIYAIRQCEPDQKVGFTVIRVDQGEEKTIDMTAVLTLRPPQAELLNLSREFSRWILPRVEGLLDLTIDLDAEGEGVKILDVKPESPLAKGGLRAGDVITHFYSATRAGRGFQKTATLSDFWFYYRNPDRSRLVRIRVSRIVEGETKVVTLTARLATSLETD
jgi:S1-C subfamily serine protease